MGLPEGFISFAGSDTVARHLQQHHDHDLKLLLQSLKCTSYSFAMHVSHLCQTPHHHSNHGPHTMINMPQGSPAMLQVLCKTLLAMPMSMSASSGTLVVQSCIMLAKPRR